MSKESVRDELAHIANSLLYLYDDFIDSLIRYAENKGISEADMEAALRIGYSDDLADSYVDGVADYNA